MNFILNNCDCSGVYLLRHVPSCNSWLPSSRSCWHLCPIPDPINQNWWRIKDSDPHKRTTTIAIFTLKCTPCAQWAHLRALRVHLLAMRAHFISAHPNSANNTKTIWPTSNQRHSGSTIGVNMRFAPGEFVWNEYKLFERMSPFTFTRWTTLLTQVTHHWQTVPTHWSTPQVLYITVTPAKYSTNYSQATPYNSDTTHW